MHKYILAVTLLYVQASTGALAHSGSDILACLKENRPKLSTACREVLVSHGQ